MLKEQIAEQYDWIVEKQYITRGCPTFSKLGGILSGNTAGATATGGDNEGQVRALVASIVFTVQVIQAVDANGYFYINISGANMNVSVVRIVGYFV